MGSSLLCATKSSFSTRPPATSSRPPYLILAFIGFLTCIGLIFVSPLFPWGRQTDLSEIWQQLVNLENVIDTQGLPQPPQEEVDQHGLGAYINAAAYYLNGLRLHFERLRLILFGAGPLSITDGATLIWNTTGQEVGAIRNVWNATGPPSNFDDETQGFGIGSHWVNGLTGDLYVATSVAASAAQWISPAGAQVNLVVKPPLLIASSSKKRQVGSSFELQITDGTEVGQTFVWGGTEWLLEPQTVVSSASAGGFSLIASNNVSTGVVTLNTLSGSVDFVVVVNYDALNQNLEISLAAQSIGSSLLVPDEIPINLLADVNTATMPPVAGNVLQWNGNEWVPGVVSGGGGGSFTLLSAATDPMGRSLIASSTGNVSTLVTLSGSADGKVAATYNAGTENIAISLVADTIPISFLSDVESAGALSGDVLSWNGTQWRPITQTIQNIANVGSGQSLVANNVAGTVGLNSISATTGVVATLDNANHNIGLTLDSNVVPLMDSGVSPSVGSILQWNGTVWSPISLFNQAATTTATYTGILDSTYHTITSMSVGSVPAGIYTVSFSANGAGTSGTVAIYLDGSLVTHSVRAVAGTLPVSSQALVTVAGGGSTIDARLKTTLGYSLTERSLQVLKTI